MKKVKLFSRIRALCARLETVTKTSILYGSLLAVLLLTSALCLLLRALCSGSDFASAEVVSLQLADAAVKTLSGVCVFSLFFELLFFGAGLKRQGND